MIEWVTSLIGTILYPLFSVVFLVIDVLQDIFGAFAGIDVIYYNGQAITSGNTGAETDTGIVYFLLTSDLAKNIFFSMLILAIILLLIFLAMAFIRNVYSAQTKNWKELVGLAIKGIGNFIFIPVGALLGVWLGNIVLQAINGATASGNSMSISRQLFVCSAYNANKLRGEEYQNGQMSELMIEAVSQFCSQYGISVDTSQTDPAYYADCIDDAYGTGGPSISWYWEVDDWYSLWNINYVVLVVGGIFILYALGALSFGMIKRVFMLLLLFVMSPIVCSMYPLDNGSAAGKWRQSFLKQTISAYSAVAGMNLFFALLPIIQNIEFAAGGAKAFDALGLTSILLLIATLYMAKEFISVVNSFVGADDAFSAGASLMGNVKTRVKNGQKHLSSFTKSAVGTFTRAAVVSKNGGSFWKSVGGSMLSGVIGKKDAKGNRTGGLLQKAGEKLMMPDIQAAVNEGRDQARSDDNVAEGKKQRAKKILKSIKTNDEGENVGAVYSESGRRQYHADAAGRKDIRHRIADTHVYTDDEIKDLAKQAGIYDEAKLSQAKKAGAKSQEDMDKDIESAEAIKSARKAFETANTKYSEMLSKDTLKVKGLDVQGMSAEQFNALQSRMKNGEMYSGNDLSVDTIIAQRSADFEKTYGQLPDSVIEQIRNEAQETVAMRQAENRAVEQFQEQKQNVQSLADAFVQALEKAQKDKKTDALQIDKSSIDEFKNGVTTALDENAEISVKKIQDTTDAIVKLKDSVEKEVVKEIRDAAKKLEKAAEEKKQRDSVNKK